MRDNKTTIKGPLVEAMWAYNKDRVYPFHTPGHKGGRGLEAKYNGILSKTGQEMDVGLMGELDSIHAPKTYIKEAQANAAKLYGADRSFFAINGTSEAIHAMVMSTIKPGEKILLPRNAHRSVAGAIILAGAKCEYINPCYNEKYGFNTQITPLQVKEALDKDSSIKAVLITTPNYYGLSANLREIIEIVHAKNAVVLVDEAHGPHLGFSKEMPESALSLGADLVSQSTHKILGAMTQCSILHANGKNIDLDRVAATMSLLTSTSPNYLLLGSIDAACTQFANCGTEMMVDALLAAEKLRVVLRSIPSLCVLEAKEALKIDCVGAFDPTKVTVKVSGLGLTGIEVGDALRRARIAVELVDKNNVLFLVTYADNNSDYESALFRIKTVFERLEKEARENRANNETKAKVTKVNVENFDLPKATQLLDMREAFYSDVEVIPFKEAEGRICGEQISFYPPGIPVILPGEQFSKDVLEYCFKMLSLNLVVNGPQDISLKTIRVVKE